MVNKEINLVRPQSWELPPLLKSSPIQRFRVSLFPHKADATFVDVEQDEPLRAECAHFLECIATRKPARTDGAEGLRVLKILNACQESLEKEQKVIFSEAVQPTPYFVHTTAEIDDNCTIGNETKIWHYSPILSDSKIGQRCNIGQNVVIGQKRCHHRSQCDYCRWYYHWQLCLYRCWRCCYSGRP